MKTAKTKKAVKKHNTEIYQHVVKSVKGHKQRVGVLYATLTPDKFVNLGWSKANVKAGDRFDSVRGLNLAKERAKADEFVPAPPSFGKDFFAFEERCMRYFKGAGGFMKVCFKKQVKKVIKKVDWDKNFDHPIASLMHA